VRQALHVIFACIEPGTDNGFALVLPYANTGDSDEYLEDADLEECACPCGGEEFEITGNRRRASGRLRCPRRGTRRRCPACGLTAVYGDWKNEFNGYRDLLARV
jgi:hypothetical protein